MPNTRTSKRKAVELVADGDTSHDSRQSTQGLAKKRAIDHTSAPSESESINTTNAHTAEEAGLVNRSLQVVQNDINSVHVPAESDEPKNAQAHATTKTGQVYRVRGLPLDFNKKKTHDLISNLLKAKDIAPVFTIRSFAKAHDGETSVATLSFQETPDQLLDVDEWCVDIPDSSLHPAPQIDDFDDSMQHNSTLTFDNHFKGITVLSCPSTAEHKVE